MNKKIDLQQRIIDRVKSQTEKDATPSSVYKPYYNALDKQKKAKEEKTPVTKPTKPLVAKQQKPLKPKPIKQPKVASSGFFLSSIFGFLKPKRKLKVPVLYPEKQPKKAKKSSIFKIFIFALLSFMFVTFAGFFLYIIVTLSSNDISYGQSGDANKQFLHVASRESAQQLDKLAHNFDVNFATVDERGRNAISLALMYNSNTDIVPRLISYGVDLNAKDDQGYTPLMYGFLSYKSPDLLLDLINLSADVNATTNSGTSILMTAIATNTDIGLIKLLIAKGANINYKNSNNVSALMIAAKETKDPNIITLLLEQGAEPFGEDKKGVTALDIAKTNPNLEGSEAIKDLEMRFRKHNDPNSGDY